MCTLETCLVVWSSTSSFADAAQGKVAFGGCRWIVMNLVTMDTSIIITITIIITIISKDVLMCVSTVVINSMCISSGLFVGVTDFAILYMVRD